METKFAVMILFIILSSLVISPVFAKEDARQLVDVGNSALWVEMLDDKVYVTNPQDGKIVIIDANTNNVTDSIDTPLGITIIEIVPEKNKIYASVHDQNKVFVFDLTTHEQIKEIDIGEPEVVLFSKSDKPYGQREYTYFETNAVGLKYNHNNEMLYAVHAAVNHINVIDTNTDTVVDTITVGKTPLLIEIDEASNTGYVTNWESNDVSVLDLNTNKVIDTLPTGFVPDQMEIDHDNLRLYVTHHASPHVTVIDLRDKAIETTIQLKGPTHAIALDSKNNLLHVTYIPESGFTGSAFINRVEFIDTKTNTNVGGFDIDNNPFTIAIDSENQRLFAPVIASGEVIALDLARDPRVLEVLEEQDNQGTSQIGGGCLIATATFGTELAYQVQSLREIRDNTLLSTTSGATFMIGFNHAYYSFSPTIADWERQNPIFKESVKAFITPMISTLSIMQLTEHGSEEQVIGLGISVIALNLGIYVIAPTVAIVKIRSLIGKN